MLVRCNTMLASILSLHHHKGNKTVFTDNLNKCYLVLSFDYFSYNI